MSDEDLIFLIRANSQAAEKVFYKRYSEYSLHLANKYYHIFKKNSGITLEELYAIAFSKTHEAVLRFDEIDKTFYAYWRTMVKNAIYDYVRTNAYEAGGKIFAGLSLDHKRYYDNEVIMLSDVVGEDEKVRTFAKSKGLEIVGEVPRSDDITRCEDRGMTTIEADPGLPVSRTFLELAQKLMDKPQ
jgi:hypothetical protein